jgi:hypothetical protein
MRRLASEVDAIMRTRSGTVASLVLRAMRDEAFHRVAAGHGWWTQDLEALRTYPLAVSHNVYSVQLRRAPRGRTAEIRMPHQDHAGYPRHDAALKSECRRGIPPAAGSTAADITDPEPRPRRSIRDRILVSSGVGRLYRGLLSKTMCIAPHSVC